MDKQLEDIADKMMEMQIKQLEAMYNNLWRQIHNDLRVDACTALMSMIEIVVIWRDYEITGYEGSYEFKETK